jgi:hypothetical protein
VRQGLPTGEPSKLVDQPLLGPMCPVLCPLGPVFGSGRTPLLCSQPPMEGFDLRILRGNEAL